MCFRCSLTYSLFPYLGHQMVCGSACYADGQLGGTVSITWYASCVYDKHSVRQQFLMIILSGFCDECVHNPILS